MMQIFDRYPELRQVVANTKTGHAFRGVLWQRRRGYLVLRNAEMLRPGGEAVAMDGELVIERENVDFLQVLN
jgi:small nuclear ribonucleoprotein (snRNP)-like protein